MRAIFSLIAVAMCAVATASSAQTPREQSPLRDILRVRPGNLLLRDAPVPVIVLGNPHWWERFDAARTAAPPGVFAPPGADGDQDVDGDGFLSLAFRGNDCNDQDARSYPGNSERADEIGHDEDCDPTTIANSNASFSASYLSDGDSDGDGFVSYRVFNFARNDEIVYAIVRGPDCNDSVRSINPIASELAGDHVDNNCNGEIDEPLPAAALTDYIRPVEGMMRPSEATRR